MEFLDEQSGPASSVITSQNCLSVMSSTRQEEFIADLEIVVMENICTD